MKELRGLYLVVDPRPGISRVQKKLEEALEGGVRIIQIWDRWEARQDKKAFASRVVQLAGKYNVPAIINNDIPLAMDCGAYGVHFDRFTPEIIRLVKEEMKQLKVGVTMGASPIPLDDLKQARVDYISFCSMYPSASADTCDLVNFQDVKEACLHFDGAVFAAGGITRDNAGEVMQLGLDGIALVSAVMSADHPREATSNFSKIINQYINEERVI